MFSLSNKVAIVTGASRGIGKVIAEIFSLAGAHVICLARTEDAIQSLAKKINSNGGSASFSTCDISDGNAFSSMINNTVKEYGKLDILINNAGVTQDSLLMRMKEGQWDTVLNINLKGAFHGMKSAIRPMMKNRGGRIINITSIVGLTGNAGQANYAASKAGLIGMSQSVAKEVASRSITVNCIAPGWIETDMTEELSENVKKEFLSKIPIRKIGLPQDIAYTALFLASDEAKYITGQTITVDGGRIIN
ncbi:MAG: 3-oxoacyl-[acyl-carrier-protein] reductase [Candidatus Marinimicrobia bacterium]|nr:3-oxoacyl-[acyl-carrier-protein] reductase [Candidatus Neomarinimicrobiota bacterium]